jgi:hypothetical protein
MNGVRLHVRVCVGGDGAVLLDLLQQLFLNTCLVVIIKPVLACYNS